jgi:hypothetical protein
MKIGTGFYKQAAALIGCLLFVAGCASSDVEKTEAKAADQELAKPSRIIVADFTASPEQVRPGSEIAELFEERDEPVTDGERELGRELGGRAAEKIVAKLQELGINAQRAASAGTPAPSDVLIEGYFVTIDQGDRLQRMLIGFGMGAAELRTIVEVYQMTGSGLKNLGFAEIEAEGGNMPGMLVSMGAGAVTGNLAKSPAIGGGVAVVKEVGPETIEAAAERTASEVVELVEQGYEKRGWL